MAFVTFNDEKHKLVHVGLFGEMLVPKPGMRSPGSRRQVFHLVVQCGKRRPRGFFKTLGLRSKRFPTCMRCAYWPEYPPSYWPRR